MAVTSSVNTPSYTATSWLHLTHIDKDLHASAGVAWKAEGRGNMYVLLNHHLKIDQKRLFNSS